MKTIKDKCGDQLKLMEVPAAARTVVLEEFTRCAFCGLTNSNKGKKPVIVNGLRINGSHSACIRSAKRPLFDMSENLYKAKKREIETKAQIVSHPANAVPAS